MILLAQLQTVPGEEIKNFALILLAILGGAYYGKGIFQKKQQREISFVDDAVPKATFTQHVERNQHEHDQLFAKINGVDRGSTSRMESLSKEWRELVDDKVGELISSNDAGREKLHSRINACVEKVASLETATQLQNQALASLGGKLDRLIERKS